jgi:ribonuclease HI
MIMASATLYTDGAFNKETQGAAWASVVNQKAEDVIESNKDLFPEFSLLKVKLPVGDRTIAVVKFNDVSTQQNNGAELVSMLFGLRIALKDKTVSTIYSDSQLIVDYWSQGKINSKTKSKMDYNKLKIINEVAELRRRFEYEGGHIIKISGDSNPADLGYHK